MARRFRRHLLHLLIALAAAVPATVSAEIQGSVAFAQDDLSNDWRRAQVAAVRDHLADYPGVELEVTDARGDASLQALHVERLARRGVDVLITSPADGKLLEPVIRRVHRNGTPVILLDRRIPGAGFTAFVHPDNRQVTQRLASFLLDRLEGEGRILMLKGLPEATPTLLRTRTFLAETKRHPGISVTSRVGNYLRGDALRAVEAILRTEGGFPFDAIYAQSDSMAVGARMALRRGGIDPGNLLIAGIDYIQAARKAIRNGEQAVSYTYPTGGQEGAELALRLLQGESVPRELVLDSVQVTADNLDAADPIF
ncbi:substrate-binding domain-containing protein [Thiohalorhabdus sp.]|uniref:substrate-binding domain-containing protein n=1 Tax=Thiohalorhabdus sp. TaxID=3094134 RepID=UPI002FC32BD5